MKFHTPDKLLLRPIPTKETFHKFNQYSSYSLVSIFFKYQVDWESFSKFLAPTHCLGCIIRLTLALPRL